MSPFKNSLNVSTPKAKKLMFNKTNFKNTHKQNLNPVENDDDLDN